METNIDTLPDEVLREIFSWLGQKDKASCSKVCKTWKAVGNTVSLWKDEEARLKLDTVTPDVLRNLGRRRVGRVCITGGSRPGALNKLFRAHPNMSSLDLRSCDKGPPLNIASEFCVSLPHLKTLTIGLRSKASAEEFMDASSRHFPQVENLTLTQGDFGFNMKELCEILNLRFRNLKKLVVSAAGKFCKGYIRLGEMLPGCDLPDAWSRLEHLRVCNGDRFTCPTLDWIDQSYPFLKCLQLAACDLLNFSQLDFVARLPELSTLDIVGCTFRDKDVSRPGFRCPTLLRLSIYLHRDVQEDDMVRLICYCFPSLKELEPIHRVFSYGAIMELTGRLPHLEKMRMPAHSRSIQRRLEEQGLGHLLDTGLKSQTRLRLRIGVPGTQD